MNAIHKLGASLLCAGAVAALQPAPVRACEEGTCTGSLYFPPAGTVPANLPGILWWPARIFYGDEADAAIEYGPESLRLARVDGATPERIDVDLQELPHQKNEGRKFLIVPRTPFVPGARYVAWDATSCFIDVLSELPPPHASDAVVDGAHFEVSAAAPLPSALGSLSAGAITNGEVSAPDGAACRRLVLAAYVDLTPELAAEAQPWADALFYATELDGMPYAPRGGLSADDPNPGTPWTGRTHDRAYAVCGGGDFNTSFEAQPVGDHRARMLATIPGTDLALATDEVAFTLECPAEPTADSGPTSSSRPDASTPRDAGSAFDAAVGHTRDGGSHGADADGINDADDGCSCSALHDRTEAPSYAWLIGILALWRARARRKPR